MKKITLSLAAVAALVLFGLDTQSAEAGHGYRGVGFHFAGPFLHIDVGNPHGYSCNRTHVARRHAPAHVDWHDTSHYDYIPPHAVRHGNHIDYVPGRMQFHREGHWDVHRGHHRGHQRW